MQTFQFDSSSSDAVYTTVIGDDGRLGCSCRGWIIRRGDKPRECSHTKKVVAENGSHTVQKGEFLFVSNKAAAASAKAPAPVAKSAITGYVAPMLAEGLGKGQNATIDEYDPALWVMEIKYDGHRVVGNKVGDQMDFWSRPKAGKEPLVRRLPAHILKAFATLPDMAPDGELIFPGGKSSDVVKLVNEPKLQFALFDATSIMGRDIRHEPYDQRRAYLEEIAKARLGGGSPIILSQTYQPSFATVKALWGGGHEGVILKRRAATYQSKRSKDWIKVKGLDRKVMTILGYKTGECGPCSKILLRDDDGNETSVKWKNNAILKMLTANPQSFIGRRLVVEFNERTPDGGYRHGHWDRFEDE